MRPLRMPSSVIRAYRYDPLGHQLDVLFVSGRHYRYFDVPEQTYQEMRRAFSKGQYFNANVRDQYRYAQLN